MRQFYNNFSNLIPYKTVISNDENLSHFHDEIRDIRKTKFV